MSEIETPRVVSFIFKVLQTLLEVLAAHRLHQTKRLVVEPGDRNDAVLATPAHSFPEFGRCQTRDLRHGLDQICGLLLLRYIFDELLLGDLN